MKKRLIMFLAIVTCGVLFLSNTAPAQDYTVTITNFKYEPKELTVPVGTTVTWVNKEGVHTIQLEPEGKVTRITFDWRISAEKPLLRWLSPLLKPLFRWNHHWAMSTGLPRLRTEATQRLSSVNQ